MQKYDKKILYLDYYKENTKIKNVGFIKMDISQKECRIVITVKGIEITQSLHAKMMICADLGEVEFDQIYITHGNGTYIGKLNIENMGKEQLSYDFCYGIKILIGAGTYIYTQWREPIFLEEENEIVVQETEEKVQKVEKVEAVELEIKQKKVKLEDNKWKQLNHDFPKKYPFEDERVYLSITPKDFTILTKKYQVLVNNSFLLHGFYNYKHLLLGKDGEQEEVYYIGVPGVYYEREKEVALMFGFESFECEKEPAQVGSFGYYMKRVEI